MLIRQGLNFAAHFAAGLAMGALAIAAWNAWRAETQPAPVVRHRSKESRGKKSTED